MERALLDNAVKYNRPGGTVRSLCFRTETEVCVVVTDTGVGIPQDELPRIFDRFYRVDKARSREAGGAGLGLAIAAGTAERTGGRIYTESSVGKGSEFTVRWSGRSEENQKPAGKIKTADPPVRPDETLRSPILPPSADGD